MSLFFYAQEKKALVSTNTKIYRTSFIGGPPFIVRIVKIFKTDHLILYFGAQFHYNHG